MNATANLPRNGRLAVSPYARRLARERKVDLDAVVGSGPGGRILAADVEAYRAQIAGIQPERPDQQQRASSFTFAATVSLTGFYRLALDAARVGLEIAIEDVASRAAVAGMSDDAARTIAIEADGRQILISSASGISINAERVRRRAALGGHADVSADPATASLLVLHSARAVPTSLPLLPSRTLRFVLVVDRDREQGHALLCADGNGISEIRAIAILDAFVDALEQPLALLV